MSESKEMRDQGPEREDQSCEKKKGGISRRSFLKGAGVTSLGLALTSGQSLAKEGKSSLLGPQVISADGVKTNLKVNGKVYRLTIEPRETLADVLRNRLHLTGTKISCNRGACGACTVIAGDQTVTSCMTLALDAAHEPIETIEGLQNNGLHPVQKSFVENDALQCGFCTPGMVMSCKNLMDHNPTPNLDDVKEAVRGNLCRCGTYPKVFSALLALSKKNQKGG